MPLSRATTTSETFIAVSMVKCAGSGGTIELNTSKGPNRPSTTNYNCSDHAKHWSSWFAYHFQQEGFENPYGNLNKVAAYQSMDTPTILGATHIDGHTPGPGGTQQFRITTYVKDTGSPSERYLTSTIMKE